MPTKLTAEDGEQKIKETAEISDPKLNFEIKDVVLIAKDFSYHIEPCYMKFIKCVRPEKARKKIINTRTGP